MKKVNMEAEVLAKPNPSFVHTRFGSSAAVTNAWVGDETGKIKLCLWNDQANCITIGDMVEIRNASVKAFRGERQLSLGKNGTVKVSTNQTGRAGQKLERNVETTVYA
jgi:replication factor A1